MKQIYSTLKFSLCLSVLFAITLAAKAQTASHSTGTPAWTTVATIGSTSGASFIWANTTIPGTFQKNTITSVVSPIMQYQDAAGHTSVSIAYDLEANATISTVTDYTITLIWGGGGSNQVSATGGSFSVTSGSPTRHNFTISGVSLPGNQTPFEVKLMFTI